MDRLLVAAKRMLEALKGEPFFLGSEQDAARDALQKAVEEAERGTKK